MRLLPIPTIRRMIRAMAGSEPPLVVTGASTAVIIIRQSFRVPFMFTSTYFNYAYGRNSKESIIQGQPSIHPLIGILICRMKYPPIHSIYIILFYSPTSGILACHVQPFSQTNPRHTEMRAVEKLKRPVLLKSKKTTKATPCASEINNLFNCWRNSESVSVSSSSSSVSGSSGSSSGSSSSGSRSDRCLQSVLLLKTCINNR